MSAEEFPVPGGRSERYTIVEVLMFDGRTTAPRKALYQRLFGHFEQQSAIAPIDLEVAIVGFPRHDWGVRGQAGDQLPFKVPRWLAWWPPF
jgi:Tautomerase enzyme